MRAVAMAGGAFLGAFELGVLETLVREYQADWPIIAGVSVGGLNGAVLAQAPQGNIELGVAKLVELWESIKSTDDIYKSWPIFGKLAGAGWKDAFFNSKPLWDLIDANVDPAAILSSGRTLRLGLVDLESGEYFTASEDDAELLQAVKGTSAYPGFFLPVPYHGRLITDGGARRITPIKSAIEAGATEIDVILTSPLNSTVMDMTENWFGSKVTGLKIAMRAIGLMSDEIFLRDVQMAEMYNQLVAAGAAPDRKQITMRVFAPAKRLLDNSLDYTPDTYRAMREHGNEIAHQGMTTKRTT